MIDPRDHPEFAVSPLRGFDHRGIPNKIGKRKEREGRDLETTACSGKRTKEMDFNEEHSKLKRIPHSGLTTFLKRDAGSDE